MFFKGKQWTGAAVGIPNSVNIVEVGPRDGLQNESQILPTAVKVDFINRLATTGLQTIEATSFVSAKWIPQLADAADVFKEIKKVPGINFPVLIPNQQGLESAIQVGVKTIAVFTAASETFCQKNTNCSLQESMARIEKITQVAQQHNLTVRGYISCTLGCPYEGEINPNITERIAKDLLDLGCYQISLGDTIGVGTPLKAKQLIDSIAKDIALDKIAMHFHDTYGQALANIYAVLEQGIQTFDSSIGGLGGCPYAKGASGNVATEDVLYMFKGMGIETGVDLDKILAVSKFICNSLGRNPSSKVALAKLQS